jgi:two-component system LytT family response regulator
MSPTKNQNINILIIDSDQESTKNIRHHLAENPLVSALESVLNTDLAIRKIIVSTPDLIILEYPAKGDSEKELIELVKTRMPETTLVLTSDTKENAAYAIKYGIFKYLLKPVAVEEIENMISEVHQAKQTQLLARINELIEKTPEESRIRIQTTKGYFMLNPEDLIFCKASGFYTELYLTRNRTELCSQYLMKFDEMLEPFRFIRASRSYLINPKYIRKIYRNTNTIVLSHAGKEYEIKANKTQIKNINNFGAE